MKRVRITTLMLLVFACAVLSSAHAEMTPVRVLLGKRELVFAPSAVYDGRRVLAPLTALGSLGGSHSVSADGSSVTMVSAGGESVEVGVVDVNGTRMVVLDHVLDLIGAESTLDLGKKAVSLRAQLQSVEFVDRTLKVNCSLPVTCTVFTWSGKLIVDISGCKLATEAKEVSIGDQVVTKARLGQFTEDTARVVLDLTRETGYRLLTAAPATQLALLIDDNLPAISAPSKPQQSSGSQPAKSYRVEGIRIEQVDDSQFNVVISTAGTAAVGAAFGVHPPQVVLNLKGGTLSSSVLEVEGSHPLLKSARVSQESGNVRVVLDFTRVMTYSVRSGDAATVVSIRPPARSGGSLAGKFVVIDPGHGGREKGATFGSVYEKDLNSRISAELVAALEREGARTMLTRSGDYVMGLAARPEVAINNNADFFISIHCNSNGSPNSATGIETYYHMYDPSPMALAYAIHAAMCNATGMCDRRARSDRTLYTSGLAVLRRLAGTGIPGVLLECGYINHSSDRARLTNSEYRKKLAAGIVAGLKAYVEGTPIGCD